METERLASGQVISTDTLQKIKSSVDREARAKNRRLLFYTVLIYSEDRDHLWPLHEKTKDDLQDLAELSLALQTILDTGKQLK